MRNSTQIMLIAIMWFILAAVVIINHTDVFVPGLLGIIFFAWALITFVLEQIKKNQTALYDWEFWADNATAELTTIKRQLEVIVTRLENQDTTSEGAKL